MFRKAPAPAVSDHAKLRGRQISEFLKLNPSAQQGSSSVADGTTSYTLQLAPSVGALTLTILLGPLFPERPPVCQLTHPSGGRLQHAHLDGHGYLSLHPKLQPAHWSPHQNLGLLVQDLLREITTTPPQLAGAVMPSFSAAHAQPIPQQYLSPGYGAQPPALGNSYGQPSSSPQYMPQYMPPPPTMNPPVHMQPSVGSGQLQLPGSSLHTPPIPPRRPSIGATPASAILSPSSSASSSAALSARTRPPDVPTSFPSLDALSIAQLEALLSGDAAEQTQKVKDLAAVQPEARQMEDIQRQLCVRIEELAQANLIRRDQLTALSAKTQREATQLREQYQLHQSLLARQNQARQKYTLASVLTSLDASITQLEDQSELTKERYEGLTQKSEADQALGQSTLELYIKERIVVHERAAKKERLVEMYGRQ